MDTVLPWMPEEFGCITVLHLKITLYGQKYADTWALHHPSLQNHLHESAAITASALFLKAFCKILRTWLQGVAPIQPLELEWGQPQHSVITPGWHSGLQLIPKWLDWIEFKSLWSRKPLFLHGSLFVSLCTGSLPCWNGKESSSNCCYNIGTYDFML